VRQPRHNPDARGRARVEASGHALLWRRSDLVNRYLDDREALTAQLAEDRGCTIVHRYDDPYIISGAGTVGGRGLLAGCSAALEMSRQQLDVLLVCTGALDAACASRSARRFADGQQLPIAGELNFAIAQPLVEGVSTVSDAEIIDAMRFLFDRMKVVVEPSGASALDAALAGKLNVSGLRVEITLSGGNIDARRFGLLAELMRRRHALVKADDLPGDD
jgi:threonine dehydratase